MPTETFNPDADAESTSVDGTVARGVASETFATITGGAGTASSDSTSAPTVAGIRASTTTNEFQAIERSILLFDTSSLPDNAIISAVTFEYFVTIVDNPLGNLSLVVVDSTPASNTGLVSADYSQLGSTALSNLLTMNGLSTNAYNLWTLNPAGRAAVSLPGITKLGFMVENDRSGSAPSWSSNAIAAVVAQMAEGANPPKLNVTFVGAARTNAFFI